MLNGYRLASAEYEAKLFDPYCDEEDDRKARQEYEDWITECNIEEAKLDGEY